MSDLNRKGSNTSHQSHMQLSLWNTVKAVLWSFLGIRRRADFQKDVERLQPLHLLAIGIALAFVFVLSLMLLVNWVAQG